MKALLIFLLSLSAFGDIPPPPNSPVFIQPLCAGTKLFNIATNSCLAEGSGGGANIGDPIGGGDPNDVLFVDPFGNLGQDDTFQYTSDSLSVAIGTAGEVNIGATTEISDDGESDSSFVNTQTGAQLDMNSAGQVNLVDSSLDGIILDGSGNTVIQQNMWMNGVIQDSSIVESIDPNTRQLISSEGSLVMVNWDRADQLVMNTTGTATINGATNNTVAELNDTLQAFDVSGQVSSSSGISFTPGTFPPFGVSINDFSDTGTFSGASDTYTVLIFSVNDDQIVADTFSGTFLVGDTVTASISGTTFTVQYSDGSANIIGASVSGSFTAGDVLTDGTTGATANYDSDGITVDVYNWSDTQSNSGAGFFQNGKGLVTFSMSNGLTGNFSNSSMVGTRKLNDTWVFSYTVANPSFFQANFFDSFAAIGDWESAINGVYINSNVGAGENQVGGNLDMQSTGTIINEPDAVNPGDVPNLAQVEALSGGLTIGTTPITGGNDNAVLFQSASGNTVEEDTNYTFSNTLGTNSTLTIGNAEIRNDNSGSSFIENPVYGQQIELDNSGNMYFDSSYGTVAYFSASDGSFTAFNDETVNGNLSVNGGAAFNGGIIMFNPSTYPVVFSELGLGIGFYGLINESGSVESWVAEGDGGGIAQIEMDASDGRIILTPGTADTILLEGLVQLQVQSSGVTPSCSSAGLTVYTSLFVQCVCNGSSWVTASTGSVACTF